MISADAIRGYVDLMILSILTTRPSYAYELAHTISDIAQGEYAIKQTTLYSALKRMEASGLVSSYPDVSSSGKPRTYYKMTTAGSIHLADKTAEWESTRSLVDRFVKGRS